MELILLNFVRRAGVTLVVIMTCISGRDLQAQTSPGALSPTTSGEPTVKIVSNTTTTSPTTTVSGKIITTSGSVGPPQITIGGTGNTDPWIYYSLTAVNDSPTNAYFYFAFGIPIVPTNSQKLWSDLIVYLNDDDTNGLASLIPTWDGVLQRGIRSTDGGQNFQQINEFLPLGIALNEPGSFFFYDSQGGGGNGGGEGPKSLNSPDFNYLEVVTSFTLSAGDSVNLFGSINIEMVPEPSAWALFLCGMVGVGVAAWRRRVPQLSRST